MIDKQQRPLPIAASFLHYIQQKQPNEKGLKSKQFTFIKRKCKPDLTIYTFIHVFCTEAEIRKFFLTMS